MELWLATVVVTLLCVSSEAQQSVTLLPSIRPLTACRKDVSFYSCSGSGPSLSIRLTNLQLVSFFATDSQGLLFPVPGTTFQSILMNIDTPINGNANMTVTFSINNTHFGSSETINVMCSIPSVNPASASVNILGEPQEPVDIKEEILSRNLRLAASGINIVPVRIGWNNSSPMDVSYYRIVERNGQMDPIDVRSPSILLNLNESTVYNFNIQAFGPCGSSAVASKTVDLSTLTMATCSALDIRMQVQTVLIFILLGVTLSL